MGQAKAWVDGNRFKVDDGDGSVFVFAHVTPKSPTVTHLPNESTISATLADPNARMREAASIAHALGELGGFRFPS